MSLFDVLAVLISLTALFSYINYRFIGLPVTIGVMAVALIFSLALSGLDLIGFELTAIAESWLSNIEFSEALLHGMLSFLLFAGAIHFDISRLADHRASIAILAILGTLISMFLIGSCVWWLARVFEVSISYTMCLLFGALISPTDPIAVMGILKRTALPESLRVRIIGESLFNDGVAVVAFVILLGHVSGARHLTPGEIGLLVIQESLGGAFFGLGVGYLVNQMLKRLDHAHIEVLITLAAVTGGYALAENLGLSGPIAIVVQGLLIGNHSEKFVESEGTRRQLDLFWEIVDDVLNAILFVLLGLEVLVMPFTSLDVVESMAVIPVVIGARFVAITLAAYLLRPFRPLPRGAIRVMTWGGLRGGVSVALALSLPESGERDVVLTITYSVVIFSILCQGLTIRHLIHSLGFAAPDRESRSRSGEF